MIQHDCFAVVSGLESGMCELTNQSRLSVQEGGLKETGAKTEVEYRAEALDSIRKPMCFLSTKAYKPVLVVTQNEITNLKISVICPLYMTCHRLL